jgi:hypothetical protein
MVLGCVDICLSEAACGVRPEREPPGSLPACPVSMVLFVGRILRNVTPFQYLVTAVGGSSAE